MKTASGWWSRTYCGAGLVEGVALGVAVRGLAAEAAVALQEGDHFPAVAAGDRAKRRHVLLGVGVTEHHDPFGDRCPGGCSAGSPASSGSLGTFSSVHSPSMSAHSFFMASRSRDDLGLRRRLAGVLRASGRPRRGSVPCGCAAAAASSAMMLLCHTDTGPARSAPQAAITTAVRQARHWGQCHSRSGFSTNRVVSTASTIEAATIARPWTRFGRGDARRGEGQHQQRPVPEVQGVGVVPERHQRLPGQETVHAEAAAALPGHDDGSRGQRRPERDEAGEGPVHGEQQAAGEHRGEAGPAEDDPQASCRA